MAYLNHDQIMSLVERKEMLNVNLDNINAASLDVTLGDTILIERYNENQRVIDYRRRDAMSMAEVKLDHGGFILRPGETMLAHTVEHCNFADDTAALFRIKSSMGRIFLEHMDAGWVDPGFHGALTLEFKNMSQFHSILLRPGDRIGQLVFFKGEAVAEHQSYRTKGNYNAQSGVKQVGYK